MINQTHFFPLLEIQPVRMYTQKEITTNFSSQSYYILYVYCCCTFSLLGLLLLFPEPSAAAASLAVLPRVQPAAPLPLPTAADAAADDPLLLLLLLPATIRCCCCAGVGANVRFNKKAEECRGDRRRQPRASALFLVINLGLIMSASRLARRSIVPCHRGLCALGA